MKNKYLYFFIIIGFVFFQQSILFAENLEINANNIKADKSSKLITLEGNVEAIDSKNNQLFAEKAKYNKSIDLLETFGDTKIITSEGYIINGKDISFDNINKLISSQEDTKVTDKAGNITKLNMFNYLIDKKFFLSKGNIEVVDIHQNNYKFSEIYIDEKKSKIVGTEARIFLNDDSTKINTSNEPRIFGNTLTITESGSTIEKGVCTYCKNKGEGVSPPWQVRAKKISHNPTKKTIFYDHAVIKIYDFPIFYLPKFSHPDPTVKRRSGFLMPNLTSNSTVGSATSVPYFWAMAGDKDLTITPKFYFSDKPLFLTEYRQDFEKSFLIVDGGFTSGYKEKTNKKSSGSRTHLFSKFNMNLFEEEEKNSNIQVNLQHVSNGTYFKVHDVNTALTDSDITVLENTLNYDYQSEDLFLGATISAYENLSIENNSKYEYLLPYITLDKNLLTDEKYGFLDLNSKLRVRNYNVNNQTEFLVNDFNWKSNKSLNSLGFESQFEGLLKTVNYNASNTTEYKNKSDVSELSGVLGYLTKIGFYKNNLTKGNNHLLTPKLLIKYAPGHMRDVGSGSGRLRYSNLYDINKMGEIDVVEDGVTASLGFDYKKNELDKDGNVGKEVFSLSAGQVLRPEENMDIPSQSSLDQKMSDVVGESALKINDALKLDYTFAIDQSYKEFNSNEAGAEIDLGKTSFNVSYLQEKNHVGNQEFVESGVNYELNESNEFAFSTRRNLLTSSAEFYNLSYNYINDCLKAGLVFRREFYLDKDVAPDNTLMFTISIVPFANINSPNIKK